MPNYRQTFYKSIVLSVPTPYTIAGIVSTSPGVRVFAPGEEMVLTPTQATSLGLGGTRVAYMTTLSRTLTDTLTPGETVTLLKKQLGLPITQVLTVGEVTTVVKP